MLFEDAHFCTFLFSFFMMISHIFAPFPTPINYTMKKIVLVFLLLLSVQGLFADASSKGTGDVLQSRTSSTNTETRTPKHAPARTDILLIIEDSGITIRFNGDFGPGIYQFTDNATGNSIGGSVFAEAGGTEYVPFPVTSMSSFDFYIEFEDGSWSHLTWGNHEE